MSTRTQSANARPRSSASSSQEKEEDKEPRQDPAGVSAVGEEGCLFSGNCGKALQLTPFLEISKTFQ